MKKTAIEILRQAFIDAEENQCDIGFWNLVSAMRGPDNLTDTELKDEFTAKIRGRVIPEGLLIRDSILIDDEITDDELITLRNIACKMNIIGDHFQHHLYSALETLVEER